MLTIGTPDFITVKRNWYNDKNEFIKQFKDIYEFDYSKAIAGEYACDFTKYKTFPDKCYHEKYGPYGIFEWYFEKFIKDLLSLNGKKRKRKSGYTKYEVNYDWE